MQSFNNKGDASAIRARLDEAKKNDLRQSHFNVGGESYPHVSEMKLRYRPQSASVAQFNSEKKSELRASHWGVAHNNCTTAYVTSNMLNFKWVQPMPKNY